MAKLLIATNNPDKVAEFRDLLADCGWEVVGPQDVGIEVEVEETGVTYAENAHLKAQAFSRASGLAALADDSGLEVDALGGEPGALHEARGWDGRDQAERIDLVLQALGGLPPEQRTARFRAVLVLALPSGERLEEEGLCEGIITMAPAGQGGFGYDPVFLLPEEGRTMAELSAEEKNRVSHRAVAAAKICARLKEIAAN